MKFAVKPGQHVVVKPVLKSGQGLCHAEFWYGTGETVKPFFSSTWPVNAVARALIFFYHDPDTKRLRLHSIRDFM